MKITSSSIEKIDEQIEKLRNNSDTLNLNKTENQEITMKFSEKLDDTDTKVFNGEEDFQKNENISNNAQDSKKNDNIIVIVLVILIILVILFGFIVIY